MTTVRSAAGHDDGVVALSDDLRTLVWRMTRRMRSEVQDATDVPLAQQAVLALIDQQPGMTSAELARADRVRPQSMNKTVQALRDLGLVASEVSQVDARRHELRLTTSGRDLLTRVQSLRGEWLTAYLADALDDDSRETLRRAVDLLQGALDH